MIKTDILSDVVADDAEARVLGVGLDDPPQGGLRVVGHGVGFVEDADLDGRDLLLRVGIQGDLALGELLDLLAHDVDAALVRGVQLDHALLVEVHSEGLLGQRQDSRSLACARRPVEHQVRDVPGLYCVP